MSNDLFIKDGVIKNRRFIQVITRDEDGNEFGTVNAPNEMLFADGWELYVVPELTEEEKLENAKQDLRTRIKEYDTSDEVNNFSVSGIPMWLDKETRTGLMLRFNAELAVKKQETVLWYGNVSIPLQLNTAIQMLYMLEVYASACYDKTQEHLAEVDKLTTIEEVENYNYRIGYPDKLEF